MVRRERRHVGRDAAALRVTVAAAGLALAASALAAAPAAEARGFVGFSAAVPLVGPAYPYPPPVVYGSPPAVIYTPPPAAVAPAPPPPDAGAQGGNCREYQSTVTIDGRPQPTYGRACLQPDGSWRIVQ